MGMGYNILLATLFVAFFMGTAAANQVSTHFCVDTDLDKRCEEEFTSLVELNGLTDKHLLEIALEDELKMDNWEDYLWAVSIGGKNYLPQFNESHEVQMADGDKVDIWWTGWQWFLSGISPAASTTPNKSHSDGSTGFGVDAGSTMSGLSASNTSGSPGPLPSGGSTGFSGDAGSTMSGLSASNTSGSPGPLPSGGSIGFSGDAGSMMSGTIPSGSAKVTAFSSILMGYSVEVDGVQIGIEGSGSDVADGVYTFYVAGGRQHSIKVNHPQFWKSWFDFFAVGGSYTANIDFPGRIVMSS
jgi:hypothetical protein